MGLTINQVTKAHAFPPPVPMEEKDAFILDRPQVISTKAIQERKEEFAVRCTRAGRFAHAYNETLKANKETRQDKQAILVSQKVADEDLEMDPTKIQMIFKQGRPTVSSKNTVRKFVSGAGPRM